MVLYPALAQAAPAALAVGATVSAGLGQQPFGELAIEGGPVDTVELRTAPGTAVRPPGGGFQVAISNAQ